MKYLGEQTKQDTCKRSRYWELGFRDNKKGCPWLRVKPEDGDIFWGNSRSYIFFWNFEFCLNLMRSESKKPMKCLPLQKSAYSYSPLSHVHVFFPVLSSGKFLEPKLTLEEFTHGWCKCAFTCMLCVWWDIDCKYMGVLCVGVFFVFFIMFFPLFLTLSIWGKLNTFIWNMEAWIKKWNHF